jgi:hypothetical protein
MNYGISKEECKQEKEKKKPYCCPFFTHLSKFVFIFCALLKYYTKKKKSFQSNTKLYILEHFLRTNQKQRV